MNLVLKLIGLGGKVTSSLSARGKAAKSLFSSLKKSAPRGMSGAKGAARSRSLMTGPQLPGTTLRHGLDSFSHTTGANKNSVSRWLSKQSWAKGFVTVAKEIALMMGVNYVMEEVDKLISEYFSDPSSGLNGVLDALEQGLITPSSVEYASEMSRHADRGGSYKDVTILDYLNSYNQESVLSSYDEQELKQILNQLSQLRMEVLTALCPDPLMAKTVDYLFSGGAIPNANWDAVDLSNVRALDVFEDFVTGIESIKVATLDNCFEEREEMNVDEYRLSHSAFEQLSPEEWDLVEDEEVSESLNYQEERILNAVFHPSLTFCAAHSVTTHRGYVSLRTSQAKYDKAS